MEIFVSVKLQLREVKFNVIFYNKTLMMADILNYFQITSQLLFRKKEKFENKKCIRWIQLFTLFSVS